MSFSTEIGKLWPSLTKEERDKIVEFYLKHGWKINRIELVGGDAISIEWQNIYSEERGQMVKNNRKRFVEGLSENQKLLWDELNGSNKILKIKENGFSDADKEQIKKWETLSKQFRGLLSPSQEEERASIPDFTKGNW